MDVFELVAKLRLDSSGYRADLKKAADDTSKLTKASKGLQTLNTAVNKVLKVGAVAAGAAVAGMTAFAKSSVQAGMQFDSAMSQVAATMGTTVDQIGELRDFAQKMGATTAFSANQAAEALNYMALAGYDADTSMKMLPNVLNLAAAGSMDLARASDMVTDAQTALGLTTEQTNQMVDQMAKTASKTNTSVSQLGDAFLTIGATARNLKGGTVELSTVLGVLADNGIKGAEGGTHLRNAILSLQTPTKDGTEALAKLGMTYADMYDAAGNMRSLPDIFQQISSAMGGMNQQSKDAIISGIFNKTDLAAINALVGTSASRWKELEVQIRNSKGAAEEMAATQLDNLAGDITLLKSAAEGAKIAFSDGLTPAIRTAVQTMTNYLSKGSTQKALNDLGKKVGELANVLTGKLLNALPRILSLFDDGGKKIKIFAASFAALVIAIKAAVNPIGAVVTALGLLGGALAVNALTADDMSKKFAFLTDEQYRSVQASLDSADALKQVQKARNQELVSIDKETKKTKDLWKELTTLVDENGKVIEGNENRARVITSELAEALGIEIDYTDGVVHGYQEICNSIDEVIAKKEALRLYEANQQAADEAQAYLDESASGFFEAKSGLDKAQWNYDLNEAKIKRMENTNYNGTMTPADIDEYNRALANRPNYQEALTEAKQYYNEISRLRDESMAETTRQAQAERLIEEERYTDVVDLYKNDIVNRYQHLVETRNISTQEAAQLRKDADQANFLLQDYYNKLTEGRQGYTEEGIKEYYELARSMNDLVDQLDDVDNKETDIEIEDNADETVDGIRQVENYLDSINGKRSKVYIDKYETTYTSTKDASGAIGLDYVPYNKFMAELHRGEAVLTAREADEWRRGNTDNGNGGTTINQYIETVPQSPVEIAAATAAYFEQARWVMA